MLNIGWMGHGGNRYLAENLFDVLENNIQDFKFTIISEWEPNEKYIGRIDYVKWGLRSWIDDYMKFDIVLCPQNPMQPAKSHIKAITAMALGKPVVCSKHPAYEEIIIHGINGYIYKDEVDLKLIIEMLKDPLVRKLIGEDGYNSIMYKFSQRKIRNDFANYVVTDLGLGTLGQWQPLRAFGVSTKSDAKFTTTVGVVYKPLPVKYQSYGDFILDAVKSNVAECKHFNELKEVEDNCDLYIFIEFNPEWYNIPKNIAQKSVMYGWDTHSHYMYSYLYNICEIFKKVYIPGKMDVDRLKYCGFDNVYWYPEAYSKSVHKPSSNIAHNGPIFIGQVDNVVKKNGYSRYDYVLKLYERYGNDFLVAKHYYGDNYAKLLTSRRVNVDIPIANNIGTRIFESTAMGIPVVRPRVNTPGLDLFFKDEYNFFEFEPGNTRDLFEKIDYLMTMSNDEYEKLRKRMIDGMKCNGYVDRIFNVLIGEFRNE